MKRVFSLVVACSVWGAGVWLAGAADLSALDDAERKQVNEWMSQRAEIMIGAHKLEGEVSQAWGDASLRTPEVDVLRARYRALQDELLKTQREIQKRVQELPAVKDKVRQLDEAKKKERELARKIAEKTGK